MPNDDIRKIFALAELLQESVKAFNLDQSDLPYNDFVGMIAFDALITEPELVSTTRKLFENGHYSLAVEEGFKQLNNIVKRRSGQAVDGAALMRSTFSPKAPLLRLNKLSTQSQIDQQQGYMDIFAGCMTGIRNPRAHEHQYLDDANVALELLVLANHLLRMTNQAKKTRRKHTPEKV